MTISAKTTLERNVGEKTFADSLILPTRQNLALSQNELRIISQVGSRALHELHALGNDPRHPVFKLKHRAGEDRILATETVRALAPATPDLLTAYHFFETRIAPAIASQIAITTALSLPRLLSTATSLQRFTASELVEAIQIAQSTNLELAREPIWTQLSPNTLNQIVNLQARAYEHRMLLQPGGAEVLTQREQGGQDLFVRHMEVLNGVMLADKLRDYSKSELLYLRSLGRESTFHQIRSLSREEFCAHRLAVMPTSDGRTASMQQGLLDRLINTRHSIWKMSREIISTDVPVSSTLRTAGDPTRSDPNALAHIIRNGSVVAVYTLIAELANLSDAHFKALIDRAEGNDNPSARLDVPVSKKGAAQENKIDVTWQPSLAHPELLESSQSLIKQLVGALYHADRRTLDPYFTNLTQASFTIVSEQFDVVAKSLSQVAKSRAEIVSTFASMLTSSPSLSEKLSTLLHQHPQPTTLILPQLLALFPEQLSEAVNEGLMEHRTLTDLFLENGCKQAETLPLLRVSDCTVETLDKSFSDLRKIIGQRQGSILSADYARTGGISSDYYDRKFFDHYLTHGGRVLLQHTLHNDFHQVDGAVLFSRPGVVSDEFKILHGAVSLASSVSCAELVAVAITRPPGTYHRLLRMMMAELALEGGLFSVGFVEQSNSRHKGLLESIGHKAHPLLAITNPLKGQQQNELYIPMVYRIPSVNSQAHEPWSFR